MSQRKINYRNIWKYCIIALFFVFVVINVIRVFKPYELSSKELDLIVNEITLINRSSRMASNSNFPKTSPAKSEHLVDNLPDIRKTELHGSFFSGKKVKVEYSWKEFKGKDIEIKYFSLNEIKGNKASDNTFVIMEITAEQYNSRF